MKQFLKTTAIFMCLAVTLSAIMLSGCGKSSSGGGGLPAVLHLWYPDNDGDGFGNPDIEENVADQPEGYVDNSYDCNDSDASINPEVEEIDGDSIDNNCNGEVDEAPQPKMFPDTGQTLSYTETFGEDSDYTIGDPSYTKLDTIDGEPIPDDYSSWKIVKDNVTGLYWEIKNMPDDNENIEGNPHDVDNTYTWDELTTKFIDKLNNDNFGNTNDWRIPTIQELAFLVNSSVFTPSINKKYFKFSGKNDVLKTNLWSSTPKVDSSTEAWALAIAKGTPGVYEKTAKYSVCAVRGVGKTSELEEFGPGIARDITTGLMWQVIPDGETGLTFEEALKYCEGLTLGGFKDWRLPNRNEMTSLMRFDMEDPAVDQTIFSSAMSDFFWTSTTYLQINPNDTTLAWVVSFEVPSVHYRLKTNNVYVMAVRGGHNTATRTWYRDVDQDAYGITRFEPVENIDFVTINSILPQPEGFSPRNGDCDDEDPAINPAAVDIENDGIDQNCSGGLEAGTDTWIIEDSTTWYRDSDDDKYGDPNVFKYADKQPVGYIKDNTDCNDSKKLVNPGVVETPDDQIDNDCDGEIDEL